MVLVVCLVLLLSQLKQPFSYALCSVANKRLSPKVQLAKSQQYNTVYTIP